MRKTLLISAAVGALAIGGTAAAGPANLSLDSQVTSSGITAEPVDFRLNLGFGVPLYSSYGYYGPYYGGYYGYGYPYSYYAPAPSLNFGIGFNDGHYRTCDYNRWGQYRCWY